MTKNTCKSFFKNYNLFGNKKKISVFNLLIGKSKEQDNLERQLIIEL